MDRLLKFLFIEELKYEKNQLSAERRHDGDPKSCNRTRPKDLEPNRSTIPEHRNMELNGGYIKNHEFIRNTHT